MSRLARAVTSPREGAQVVVHPRIRLEVDRVVVGDVDVDWGETTFDRPTDALAVASPHETGFHAGGMSRAAAPRLFPLRATRRVAFLSLC